MRVRRPALPLLILVLLAFAPLPTSAAGEPDWQTPNKEWVKGPVQWIMTDDEEKEFKKLKTDEERAAFAKTFWEKRDPTPGTPQNEYELIFWKRVEQADKVYKEVVRQGSLSALGRAFLLLGPPTSTRKDSRYVYWDYVPDEINGLKEKIELQFSPGSTGVLLLAPKTLENYVEAHPETRGIGWKIPQLTTQPAEGEVVAAPVKEHVEDTSPESQRQIPILDAVLAKGGGPTDVPFQVTNDFYAAIDGTTLVVTTVEVPRDAAHGSGDQALLVFGRLAPASGEGRVFNLTGDLPFVPAPEVDSPAGGFVYQARRNLKPGAWKEVIVIEDKVIKGQMGTLVSDLQVPDYSTKQFEMSSVSILAHFGRIEESVGPDDSKTSGLYSMGSFRIVPRANPTLQKTDTFAFYYQVYNPGQDQGTGKPSLESTYTFYLKEAGAWKPFRKPVVKPVSQVELFAIDVKDLIRPDQPLPAEFRMEAKVTDKTSGQSVSREINFTIR
jgi:GWxTD domain-containing protein